MKKISIVLLLVVFIVASMAGCSGQPKAEVAKEVPTTVEDLKGKTIGTITWFGYYDEAQLLQIFTRDYGVDFKEVKSFDSESALIMALDTGKIDAAWLRDFQAKEFLKETEKYSITTTSEQDKMAAGSARMVAAKDAPEAAELEKINTALAELREDGTLAQLQKEYIDEFDFSKNFESIQMPVIEGAPTYKVSISGSMIPLDYIAADGNPTGFSIALLAEISKKANMNFELVTIGVGSDRLELLSNKIDYIFCYTLTDYSMDRITDLVFSDPYFSYESSALMVRK